MTALRIPLYRPDLSGNERKFVLECLDSTWISSNGPFVAAFEREFARFCGAAGAVSVCNGTVALHVALLALGIGPGDEVIVPSLTYVAPVNAIAYTGARPVFVDSLESTWQMDPAEVVRRITPRTRAILAVHLYGHPCDLGRLAAVAREHRIHLVEDCAEGLGALFGGRHVGTFGAIGTFSFYGNKTITTGEGGMLVSDDPAILERARHLKGQGLVTGREYWHDVVGYNYRMTNVCAAIGLAQLERIAGFIARKREIARVYGEALEGLPLDMHREAPGATHGHWMASVAVHEKAHRDPLRRHLRERGIETRPFFHPAHTLPMYANGDRFAVAEDLAARGINLPSWPGLPDAGLGEVAATIRDYFRHA